MTFLSVYLKEKGRLVGLFFLFVAIFLAAFFLYGLPMEAVLYPLAVCLVIGLICLAADMARARRKHETLKRLAGLPAAVLTGFPEAETCDDRDYQEIIRLLRKELADLENGMDRRYADMIEYYTLWAHQIKTPIAAMRLTIQNEDSALSRQISDDLFRIEQYVEMVLMFLRLDSDTNDYVIQEYDLDGIVRQAARRFSGQFIHKKIRLRYEPARAKVITDEKWLLFVIEQALSNAVKYTPPGGTVTIDLETPKTLRISDTGIGIAPQDLPRIFEKGYTGCNGRADKRASGIGLYLCRRVCDALGHTITASASPGKGTVIRLGLEQRKIEAE